MKIKKSAIALLSSLGVVAVVAAATGIAPPLDRLTNTLSGWFQEKLPVHGPGLGNLQYQDDEVMVGAVSWVTNETAKDKGDGDIPYNVAHNHSFIGGTGPDDKVRAAYATLSEDKKLTDKSAVPKVSHAKYGTNVGLMVNGYFLTMFAPDSGQPSGGFLLYDVSNPRDIRLVKRIYDVHLGTNNTITGGTTSEFREPHAIGSAVVNGRTYVVAPTVKGVEFWDFTDINDIRQVSKLAIPNVNGGDYGSVTWQLWWQAPYLYVATANNGIYVVDATDPAAPKLAQRGGKPVVVNTGFSVGPIFTMGNHLVVTGMQGKSAWASYDISDPLDPAPLASTGVPADEPIYYASCFEGQNIYSSTRNGNGRMYGFSLANPEKFQDLEHRLWVPEQLYCATQDGYVFQGAQRKVHKVKVRDAGSDALVPFEEVKAGTLHPTHLETYSKPWAANVVPGKEGTVGSREYTNASPENVRKWMNRGMLHPQALVEAGGVLDPKTRTWNLDKANPQVLLGKAPKSAASGTEAYRAEHGDHGQVTPMGNLLYIGDDHGNGSGFMVHQAAPDTTPPKVREVSPRANAKNQKVTTRIGLAMTDSILLESVTKETFTVRVKGTQAALDGTYSVQLGIVNFSPKTPLLSDTEYEVVVKGVKDYVGNASPEFKYSFTTGSETVNASAYEHRWPLLNALNDTVGDAHGSMPAGVAPVYDSVSGALKFSKNAPQRVVSLPDTKVATKLTGTASISVYFRLEKGFVGHNNAWQAPGLLGRDAPNTQDIFWGYFDGAGNLVFQAGNSYKVTSPVKVNTGNWHHVVLARNAVTGEMRMVLDGVESMNKSFPSGETTGPLGRMGAATLFQKMGVIDGNGAPSNIVFHGEMADLRVFSKDLSLAEAQSISNQGLLNFSSIPSHVTSGTAVNFSPSKVHEGKGGAYRWNFGDGREFAGLIASHTYGAPGRYRAVLSLDGRPVTFVDVTVVDAPPTDISPTHTTNVVGDAQRVYSVNADSGTVSAISAKGTPAKLWEEPVGKEPKTLALGPDGNLWVTVQGDDKIVVLNPVNGAKVKNLSLPYGSGPHGVVFAPSTGPSATQGFVSLESKSTLLRFNVNDTGALSLSSANALKVGSSPRGIAISADSAVALVTRFQSTNAGAEVYKVNLTSAAALGEASAQTLRIPVDTTTEDAENQARGVANYLHQVVIAPNGRTAVIPSKKDNIVAGSLADPLGPETTVRSVVNQLQLAQPVPSATQLIDFNNSAPARAAVFSPDGSKLFVAQMEGNALAVVDVYSRSSSPIVSGTEGGTAPHGLYLDKSTNRLFVNNFLGRSVSVYDVSQVINGTGMSVTRVAEVKTVAKETLSPEVLAGKKVFYNAAASSMSLNSYMSCASCHSDGAQDGMTWNFTGRGQGNRSTTTLLGRSGMGHGNVHWTANFDEIQDFENDIRQFFGGTGFLAQADWDAPETQKPLGANKKAGKSTQLDNLAAYVESLNMHPRSPERNDDGSLTASALLGRNVFNDKNCASCHSGATKQDNGLHKFAAHKSKNPGDEAFQKGVDTPSLIGVWATAPYFHDGRASTLEDVFKEGHGDVTLSAEEALNLANYLRSLDSESSNFWSLKSDASDTSGGSTGTLSAASAGAGSLWVDGGLDFGRLTNGVDLPNDSVAKTLAGTSSLSFSIKTSQKGHDTMWRAPGVFGWEQVGGSSDIFWGWIDGSGRIGFTVGNGTAIKSQQSISDDKWHHVVMTRNARTGEIALYVDGKLAEKRTAASGTIPNATSQKLGLIINNTGAPKFQGVLKNVGVYDSVLKETDTQALQRISMR
ncbi:MAG: Ig-like domain-containing protein [Rhodoferax sp.]|nr:Ig-like domain-containing protein [Rhodoferax sp.]